MSIFPDRERGVTLNKKHSCFMGIYHLQSTAACLQPCMLAAMHADATCIACPGESSLRNPESINVFAEFISCCVNSSLLF